MVEFMFSRTFLLTLTPSPALSARQVSLLAVVTPHTLRAVGVRVREVGPLQWLVRIGRFSGVTDDDVRDSITCDVTELLGRSPQDVAVSLAQVSAHDGVK